MTNLSDDGARHSPSGLDEVSRRLIELLQADGRQSYATMAKEVGLSEAAVRQRVHVSRVPTAPRSGAPGSARRSCTTSPTGRGWRRTSRHSERGLTR